MKAICMYATIRPFATLQSYIQEPNANIIFGCGRHCDHDEDDDTSSQYEDPLECVICSAFCECLYSQNHLHLLEMTVLIIRLEAHAKCDRTANETGGVKSAVDEGIYTLRSNITDTSSNTHHNRVW